MELSEEVRTVDVEVDVDTEAGSEELEFDREALNEYLSLSHRS